MVLVLQIHPIANRCLAIDNFNRQLCGVSNDVGGDWNGSGDSWDRLVRTRRPPQPPDTIRYPNDDDADKVMHARSDDWSVQIQVAAPANSANFRTAVWTACMSMYCGSHCMVIELLLQPMVSVCERPSNYYARILSIEVCVISLNDYHCPYRDDLMTVVFECHQLFRSTNSYRPRRLSHTYELEIFHRGFRVPTQIGNRNFRILSGTSKFVMFLFST